MTRRPLWPFAGEGLVAIRQRVAHAYRAALLDANPEACRALDAKMVEWGQSWAVPTDRRIADDDWLPASDAAELGNVHADTVGGWRRRGRLTPDVDCRRYRGHWQYRAAAIRRMSDLRTREKGRR